MQGLGVVGVTLDEGLGRQIAVYQEPTQELAFLSHGAASPPSVEGKMVAGAAMAAFLPR